MNKTFNKILAKTDHRSLLLLVSFAQLLPENYEKTYLLEGIQDAITKHFSLKPTKFNYFRTVKAIHYSFSDIEQEEASESCFTENLRFINGNNIVFTGLAVDSTERNQLILDALFFSSSQFSKSLKQEILSGTLFLLTTFGHITRALNMEPYIYDEKEYSKITFPDSDFFQKHRGLLIFSPQKLKKIYNQLNINFPIVEDFSTTISEIKSNIEKNILITKPFVKIESDYYLVMPSAQMYCLNIYLWNVIHKHGAERKVYDSIAKLISREISFAVAPHWEKYQLNLPLFDNELIYKIDQDKFVYVHNIFDTKDKPGTERINEVLDTVQKEFSYPLEFLTIMNLVILQIEECPIIPVPYIRDATYTLSFIYHDFLRLIHFWSLNNLSLWKYCRAEVWAENRKMELLPHISKLSYFKHYKENHETLLPISDPIPRFLIIDDTLKAKVNRELLHREDRHLVPYILEGELGFLPVFKSADFFSVYTSEEIRHGKFRQVLKKYGKVIWATTVKGPQYLGKNFVEAMLYWLNRLENPFKEILDCFSRDPIEIQLRFPENFMPMEVEEKEQPPEYRLPMHYRVHPENRYIEINIPEAFFYYLHRPDNYGEFILVQTLLKGLLLLGENRSIDLPDSTYLLELLEKEMPLSRLKIIMTGDSRNNPKLVDSFIKRARYVEEADTSFILENNLGWLPVDSNIPDRITSKDKKVDLLVKIINSLIQQLRNRLQLFNNIILLKELMIRHESVLYEQAKSDQGVVLRMGTFSDVEDVIGSYEVENHRKIETSHALRTLIEFVIAEPFNGTKVLNDADTDFMLALVKEITTYGVVKDIIQFDLDNPELGKLPSGRLGIMKRNFEGILKQFRRSVIEEDILSSSSRFDSQFPGNLKNKKENEKITVDKEKDLAYYEIVDQAFKTDWGIPLTLIRAAMEGLGYYCYQHQSSTFQANEQKLKKILRELLHISDDEIASFISLFTLTSRGSIDRPGKYQDYPDIFPWRYNRSVSYLMKPLVVISDPTEENLIFWSARHLFSASENLMALFHDGSLKVRREDKNLTKLLAKRNNIKGSAFRQNVYEWLNDNTKMYVVPHEVQLNQKSIFKPDKNFGDIDILAYNPESRIAYAIECKNTRQAKIVYDFQHDLRNYLEKQLPKHIQRENFLKSKLPELQKYLNLDKSLKDIKGIVISSKVVPAKYVEHVEMPIYSFSEVKNSNVLD